MTVFPVDLHARPFRLQHPHLRRRHRFKRQLHLRGTLPRRLLFTYDSYAFMTQSSNSLPALRSYFNFKNRMLNDSTNVHPFETITGFDPA